MRRVRMLCFELCQSAISGPVAYVPHVAEGIVDEARNEFVCLSGDEASTVDGVVDTAAFIHGVGLRTGDISLMAGDGAGLIWSPRSNVYLYGFTAEVGIYDRLGVMIALGTDWTPSGSMNVQRELQCADYLNHAHYNSYFTDRQFEMVTQNAAELLGFGDYPGSLVVGKEADIAVFDGRKTLAIEQLSMHNNRRISYVAARHYTSLAVIDALPERRCEQIDICGATKRLCLTERSA